MTELDANADLLKRQRDIISRKELKPFTKRSDGPGLIYFGGLLACIGATGALIYFADGTAWLWPAMLLHGIMLGHLFAPLHECSHGTAFKTRWLNEAVLWFCGIVTIWTPIYFRYDHAGHHTYAQIKGKDPEFVLPSPRTLLGYLYYVSAVHLWVKNFGWLFRHAAGTMHPFNRQFVPDVELPRIYFEARLMLSIYAALLAISVATGSWIVAIYWFIPTIIGVPIARMIRVADHTGCTEGADLRTYARTVTTDPITRFFCWNMSYHCEHHLASSVPFHQLRGLHEKIGHELNPVDKGYIAVQWEVLTKHLSGIVSPKQSVAPAE
ncbi:MAG: fatty acid desaturase [Alphaproteobacteria bacterium]|nr:fatty acid desaturase [Alphaproteobacteria bacterium]